MISAACSTGTDFPVKPTRLNPNQIAIKLSATGDFGSSVPFSSESHSLVENSKKCCILLIAELFFRFAAMPPKNGWPGF